MDIVVKYPARTMLELDQTDKVMDAYMKLGEDIRTLVCGILLVANGEVSKSATFEQTLKYCTDGICPCYECCPICKLEE